MKFPIFALAVLGIFASASVEAHSWLVKPVSRETGPVTTDGTIGCPNTTPRTATSFSPGETIDVRYWRNNHLGGFIRWAISPVGSETAADFDNNVFFYTCRESGPDCVPADGSTNRYAGDSSGANTISCGDTITLPDWLGEGDYVLQWVWFGVGSSNGNIGWSEPQFVSCADISLTAAGTGSEPSCPTFVGGDRVTKKKDQCFYYYTNSIVPTLYKGSNNDYEQYYVFGKPSYVDKCSGSSGNSTATWSTQSPATNRKTPTPTATPGPVGSSVAGDASDLAGDSGSDEYPDTASPGGCKAKKRHLKQG